MEENNGLKVTFSKNLNKINFNVTTSSIIDSNVNIKRVLDISSNMFDTKVETTNGKAILSGKIGVKVLYLDTDNLTNILADSTAFSETLIDEAITNECFICLDNCTIVNETMSTDGMLKINCNVTISPQMFMNLPLTNNANQFENMIVKKNEIQTNTIAANINSNFDYTTNFETKYNLTKILCHNSYFTLSSCVPNQDSFTIEGTMYSILVYECQENEETLIKQLSNTFNVKTDVQLANINKDCTLDVCCSIDKSKESISTDVEDNNNVITILNNIKIDGVALSNVSLDLIDDMYSVDNEIELNSSTREITNKITCKNIPETVSAEIDINENEPAIDEIIANLDMSPEITNTYIKDDCLFVEGVISSQLLYIDENKECQQKQTQIPFIINTKINVEKPNCARVNISITDCKAKSKRGTIFDIEYYICLNVCIYETQPVDFVDNISIGKSLDFSNYDYQIFLTRPGETMWELCKRIKIEPDKLSQYNNNLPLVMEGGEKVVVKR